MRSNRHPCLAALRRAGGRNFVHWTLSPAIAGKSVQSRAAWRLARRQHGVLTRAQLLALGFSRHAIDHRLAKRRLHPLWPGVYAVGREEVTQLGRWMAAVLACGPGAALSHESAAQFWGLGKKAMRGVDVTVPPRVRPRFRGIVAHRRELRREDTIKRHGIPVTSPICTLVDVAAKWKPDNVEEAVSQADVLDLVDPETLRAALDDMPRRSGRGALKRLLDRPDFAVTRSRLEGAFVRITRRLGLPKPLTRQYVNGFEVDFYWPDLGLVVETDGLKYHRTPQQQMRDRIRDQVHTAAGLTCLRYTRYQIMRRPRQVDVTLAPVANRLLSRPA